MEFVHLFTVFDSKGKIIARYQQYFGIKRILGRYNKKTIKELVKVAHLAHHCGLEGNRSPWCYSPKRDWLEELKQCRIFLADRVV
ncbi:hypothetical protein O9929_28280 [Vibrio lentus]|nr:hypothetical protein [Vibrio lentus]